MFVSLGPRVQLPEFGIGIGTLEADYLSVHVNNRMEGGEVQNIVVVPVKFSEVRYERQRYRLFRSKASPEDAGEVVDGDLGVSILFESSAPTPRLFPNPVQPDAKTNIAQSPSKRPPAKPKKPRPLTLESLRTTSRYVSYHVPLALWDGTDGLLFLQYFGPPWEEHRSEITIQLRGVFKYKNVERCVVPRHAITRRAGSDKLCFALGSCQYTRGLLDSSPRWDEFRYLVPGPADSSYARLSSSLRDEPEDSRPELLVLAGDQVYVDGTAGLFDPAIEDGRFRKPYEQLLTSMYVQEVTRQIPICAMLDDHEIEDNWEREDEKAENNLKLGRQSYLDYQRQGSLLDDPTDPARLWSPLNFRGFHFFFADTRTDREKRTARDLATKQLMSEVQLKELFSWLLARHKEEDPDRPKFVVTPSVLVPARLSVGASPNAALRSDAWDGYPRSRYELLDFIAEEGIRNVFFLSGDEHLCVTAKAVLESDQKKIVVQSIHSSGFYTPYPFANAIRDDFVDDPFTESGGKHTWQVSSKFERGEQGFAIVCVEREQGAWRVRVTFDLLNNERTPKTLL